MKIVAIVGTKDTGKTTLVTKIIERMSQKGYRVASIKFSHVNFDLANKDTDKHHQAGAKIVVGTGKETFILFDNPLDLENIISTMEIHEKIDYLIMEGFKTSKFAKISVSELKDDFIFHQTNIKSLDEEEMENIVKLIEERSYGLLQDLDCKKCGFESCQEFAAAKIQGMAPDIDCKSQFKQALLHVNGKRLPLNPFVQNIIAKTVTGMIDSLEKDSDKIDRIELVIRNK